jgi:FkbH-like protein
LTPAYRSAKPIVDLVRALSKDDEDAIDAILQAFPVDSASEIFAALLRSAIFRAGGSPKYYRRIRNLWVRSGRLQLKSAQTAISVELLSDATIDGLAPHLELFLAAYGIAADITVGAYDSVEHEAFSQQRKQYDVTVVILSESWLRRHIPLLPADAASVDCAASLLGQIVGGLHERRSGRIIVTNFSQDGWPAVGGTAMRGGHLSRAVVVQQLNQALDALVDERILIADAQAAIHIAGGAAAAGRLATLRMRAPFEETGMIAVAREVASIAANALGRSHRALLTDWDNTLWGGEVGEVGFDGIECGAETPAGYGYLLLQQYIRDLSALGVLIGAVSRNDPAMAGVLDHNAHLALRRANFSSLALSWGDKSESVRQAASELNFGTDLMVYLDDNHVDLAEVLLAHPEIDIVLAGPDADQSLNRLCCARFFNTALLTEGDLNRTSRAVALREQRDAATKVGSKEEFLASLDIKIEISGIKPENRERVLQLLQKTNQFNLTTKRHGTADLDNLLSNGARIGVFDYRDRFGPQGIIGLMILDHERGGARMEIDTWLMSCRVLNRGVEESMLAWAEEAAAGRDIVGQYIPTAKNGLVSELYPRLGFTECVPGSRRYVKQANRKV